MQNDELIELLTNPKIINAAVEDMFTRVNTDRSGRIDKRELKIGLVSMSKELGIPSPTERDLKESFEYLDFNKDGLLCKNDVRKFIVDLFNSIAEELNNNK